MKALVQYVLLVGIPILGVLGVLHLGQGLSAPHAVSGLWDITPSDSGQAASVTCSCPTVTDTLATQTLTVEQSGPKLVLELGNLRTHGLIDRQTVRAASKRVSLNARLEASGVLRGTLSFATCPGTPKLPFTANPSEAS